MPKSGRGRKKAAHKIKQRTGAAYTSANARTTHQHPAPEKLLALLGIDSPAVAEPPHLYTRALLWLDAAQQQPQAAEQLGRLLGACIAQCQPCQRSLARRVVEQLPAPLAAFAVSVLAPLPTLGWASVSSSTTRTLYPLIREAAGLGAQPLARGPEPFAKAAQELTEEQLADLLEDALDLSMMVGLTAGEDMPEPDIRFIDVPMRETDDDPVYALMPGSLDTSAGQRWPSLTLVPEAGDAGAAHLSSLGIPSFKLPRLPALDPRWCVEVDVRTSSIARIARTDWDDEGGDEDTELWRAPEPHPLPASWLADLDYAQRCLLLYRPDMDPDDPEGHAVTAGTEAYGVIARVRFDMP